MRLAALAPADWSALAAALTSLLVVLTALARAELADRRARATAVRAERERADQLRETVSQASAVQAMSPASAGR